MADNRFRVGVKHIAGHDGNEVSPSRDWDQVTASANVMWIECDGVRWPSPVSVKLDLTHGFHTVVVEMVMSDFETVNWTEPES